MYLADGPTDSTFPVSPQQAAIRVGIEVAKQIPGVREVVGAPMKLVGKAIGKIPGIGKVFGGSKAKYRRAKKKGTRAAGVIWGQSDARGGYKELTCTGATGKGRERKVAPGCRFRGKPPNIEFVQSYKLAYWPYVNATRDCHEKAYGKRLWEKFPTAIAARRPMYRPTWRRGYDKIYKECPKSPWVSSGISGSASGYLYAGAAIIVLWALTKK